MNTRIATTLALTFVLGPVALAHADEPPAASAAVPAPAGANGDPNIDRGFLLPTAMTQPKGTVTYNNYELLLHGITVGVTDRIQISGTVLSPITKEMPFVGFAAIKGQVVNAGALHLALQGTVGYGRALSSYEDGDQAATLGAGALASLCLNSECSSLVSASATYQHAFVDGGDGGILLYGGSVVGAVGQHVKLLAEVTSAGGTNGNGYDNAPFVLASYGVRLHSRNIAGDVGFIKPIDRDGDDAGLLMGLPFVSFSYRW